MMPKMSRGGATFSVFGDCSTEIRFKIATSKSLKWAVENLSKPFRPKESAVFIFRKSLRGKTLRL